MALLVGAISARRMRHHKSILHYCIENDESILMDHDEIYNTNGSSTIPHHHPFIFGNNTVASSSHYNTFGSTTQGWKGDLEKFDV